ncbi:DUF2238 domain-containing protein [Pasteurella skyensis]|uniref:DUF2238 domain-containing protein n=1 Tax=Phocoenobacter skyensis TaxID=97481 RepID=A0AAJ6P0H1_9PAST|nr:DUF2238 domain-containing protein [Pasteurella skyensis]MDP8162203.1 DUF2238 domain-containing protein [Pasteurella skyensis]MDP8172667.1 DUF2238 domain-containing protein [Pasteurella skyensis]MDP8176829.1 DUF2238 domain-containing protein [Pasteurella skyensis]MDP8179167.1 DUF2238 domain-containing protein [Pasteurella skyensis]MDP8183378.1 DUF2238 domain-containing protein [Pasteurella skyensis]
MQQHSHSVPFFLFIVISCIAVWSGFDPVDRAVWYAESIPIFVVFGLLIITYPFFKFSGLAYTLMSFWMILHFIGAKYTFASVPFGWINPYLEPFLGEGRNHFDRVAHYIIGFYSFPIAEFVLRRSKCTLGTALCLGLFSIMSLAAAYEIIEWQYAVIEGGNAGVEFLGSQGDIWDAQKDMLADTLGAITALILYLFARPDKKKQENFFE